jgi:hypothetical protein
MRSHKAMVLAYFTLYPRASRPAITPSRKTIFWKPCGEN